MRGNTTLSGDPKQLWLPLVNHISTVSAKKKRNQIPGESPLEWEEDELFRLHGYLLEKSLKDLVDHRSNQVARAEILEWVMDATSQKAFSWNYCCRLHGLNPEELREQVLLEYRQICH